MEIEQRALEEENEIERRGRTKEEGNACVTEISKFISIRGGAYSDSASVAFSLFSFPKFPACTRSTLQTLSFRQRTFSAVDASVYEDSRRKSFPLERSIVT